MSGNTEKEAAPPTHHLHLLCGYKTLEHLLTWIEYEKDLRVLSDLLYLPPRLHKHFIHCDQPPPFIHSAAVLKDCGLVNEQWGRVGAEALGLFLTCHCDNIYTVQ